jgi:hypothetical protein
MMAYLEKLLRRAATLARSQGSAAPKDQRIAQAKRAYELELRAAGFSRSDAKHAVAVRFSPRK